MVKLKRKLAILILLAFAVSTGSIGFCSYDMHTGQNLSYDGIIDTEAEWIAGLQLENGAIAKSGKDPETNKYSVVPYFSNLTALGLLEKPEYAPHVKQYMDWYLSHLNQPDYNNLYGTVYDYEYIEENGRLVERSLGSYDSTDSYAATFLSLLRKYYEVTGDMQYLVDNKGKIDQIANVMVATLDDGLTWAKPDYKVKYLMDNAEVYKGFADMAWIYENVYQDSDRTDTYKNYRDIVAAKIEERLWDGERGLYRHYMFEDGSRAATDMRNFYADATAQLFPIWTGMIDANSERALSLYNTFNKYHPGWPVLDKGDAFPWAIIAYTAAIMGDKTRVDTFLDSVKDTYIDNNHAWPWYCMEAGMTMLAASRAKSLQAENRSMSVTSPAEGEVIKSLPFSISGTSQNIDKVEIRIVNGVTQAVQEAEVSTLPDGSWNYTVSSALNSGYNITVKAKDRFNNVYSTVELEYRVAVDTGKPQLASAEIKSDKNILKRGETANLSIEGLLHNGEPAPVEEAVIEYVTNRPDLVAIFDNGSITLVRADNSVSSIEVWAYVTLDSTVLKTNVLSIGIDPTPPTLYDAVIDAQAEWIISLQKQSGAIPVGPSISGVIDGVNYVNPRVANIAAAALLEVPQYAPLVKRYIDWYVGKMNWPDKNGMYGTVDDYIIDPATGRETPIAASSNPASCVAAFISLVKKYGDVTGDYGVLNNYQLDIMSGGIGLLSCMDTDGLVWSDADKTVKSLMGNIEVLEGLKDAIWLFRNKLKNYDAANYFEKYLNGALTGFESKMWDADNGMYAISIDREGKSTDMDWSNWEHVMSQLSAVYTGFVKDRDRGLQIYSKFNTSIPEWYNNVSDGINVAIAGGYTSAVLGDRIRADALLGLIKSEIIDKDSYGNWDILKAAGIIMASSRAKLLGDVENSVSIISPKDGQEVDSTSLKITGTSKNAVKITVELEDGNSVKKYETNTDENGSWSIEADGLVRGKSYIITARSQDMFGNFPAQFRINIRVAPEKPGSYQPPVYYNPETPSPQTSEQNITIDGSSIRVEPKPEDGTAVAELSSEDIEKALTASQEDKDGYRIIEILVESIGEPDEYIVEMPAGAFNSEGEKKYSISTPFGNIMLPDDMFGTQITGDTETVGISFKKADISGLNQEIKDMIGNRPVIEISIFIDGRKAPWSNRNVPVTVTVDYKPTSEEYEYHEYLCILYIDDSGNAFIIPSGRYDADAGKMTFKTSHLSKYAVALNKKSFNDTAGHGWAEKAIEVIASRGIINGTGMDTYEPDRYVTRGEFIEYLIDTLGLTADFSTNFDDVDISDSYYHQLGIAKQLGISKGIGGNRFDPDGYITRQDMAVLVERALYAANRLTAGETSDNLSQYLDASSVSEYARQSLSTLVDLGIMIGYGNNIDPLSYATRAQAAVVIYRLYNLY